MAEVQAQVAELVQKRGKLKDKLTALERHLNDFISQPTADLELFDIHGRLERHKPILDRFEEIQDALDPFATDLTLKTANDEERKSFENRYYAINGRINQILKLHSSGKEIDKVKETISQRVNLSDSGDSSTRDKDSSSINLQAANGPTNSEYSQHFLLDPNLPKLGLPSFSGTFDTWLGFRDIFTSMVHDNNQVPTIFKFLYLKSCVTGEAKEVINSLQSSEENYSVAWKLLTDRYDNHKFIAENHVKALCDIPAISKEYSVRLLLDNVLKHTRALRALSQSVDLGDLILVHIIKQKLNNYTRERWEEFAGTSTIPTMKNMTTFLERRAQFEMTRPALVNNAPNFSISRDRHASGHKLHPPRAFHSSNTNTQGTSGTQGTIKNTQNILSQKPCPVCKKEDHGIYTCPLFLNLSPHERINEAKKAALCFNCLRGNHRPTDCRLRGCRHCHKRHNSLLHIEEEKREESREPSEPVPSTSNYTLRSSSEVYLGTAIVDVLDSQGNFQPCRIMLDGGAQSCAITNSCATRLGLTKKRFEIPLLSIDDMKTNIHFETSAIIKSRFNNQKQKLDLLIVQTISNAMPSLPVDKNNFPIPSKIFLADPNFHESAPIDILIGAEFAYAFLRTGQLPIRGHSAILQKTMLGWIVAGRVYVKSVAVKARPTQSVCNFVKYQDLPILWELDKVKNASRLSKEEQACEKHFEDHVQRDKSGHYTVKLPFTEKIEQLGDSRNGAFQRLYALERKLEKNPSLQEKYSECINNYLEKNHMIEILDKESLNQGYFLPHHAVIKETSVTTKTRVVFDASARSSTGISLNDCLMVGPTIQEDLFSIFTRFRYFLFALTADIEQMYRQIRVANEDSTYQKILWRSNRNEPIKTYSLNRVTFGTACAPYLATRTLLQLSEDECESHPVASAILRRDFYVDDLLTGTQSLQEAFDLRNELIQLLNKGGFNLRKWVSNDPRLTTNFSSDSKSNHMSLDPTETVKTLGLFWDPQTDSIVYTVNMSDPSEAITKRSILSQTAKLFDPLGLLGPVVVSAKIFIQSLWKSQVGWDDPLPIDSRNTWLEYKNQLPLLNNARYDRCISIPNTIETQIHGFCDASEKAYGACLYLRSTNKNGENYCALICAKSRVAPLKPITIPKLELCAAVLLANLYKTTVHSLKISIDKTYFWSDSTITLGWINTEPDTLKTFVANRVTEIQSVTQPHKWLYVPTHDNPADLISRGLNPREFLQPTIWKSGPVWLNQNPDTWPQFPLIKSNLPEKKSIKNPILYLTLSIRNPQKQSNNSIQNLLEKYSSMRTLKHVVAFCQRFIENSRTKNENQRSKGPLSIKELDAAMLTILKIVQTSSFSREMSALSRGEIVDKKSSLLCLNPFLNQGIIRVGGRLEHASITQDKKHPIVLPRNHYITTLIIREEHIKRKHAGAQATLYGVRELFWPIDGRNMTRHIIHRCIKCFRAKPRGIDYIMGSLPEKRLSFSRPFLHVGVDYCGPFYIKEKRHRNRGKEKAYVSIFICFATKAVHLELVSDLTTDAFLASLSRFFSRRGKANTIHSDNGTNFVGANRELRDLYEFLQKTEKSLEVKKFLTNQKVSWHFNPPSSPHFGGLWEASVKSFKHHLTRTVGNTLLTFEQLQTYIIEIEAILNSRPLTPMSSDPNDLLSLTPGHFLIGDSLTNFPQADLRDLKVNRLSAWQHAQQMRQHFWSRWYKEYLNEMITRSKWKSSTHQTNIKVGTLVVEKDDNLPPMCWKLARITEIHAGKDGHVRVVTLRNSTGSYKRCIKKLFPLPLVSKDENSKPQSVKSQSNQ